MPSTDARQQSIRFGDALAAALKDRGWSQARLGAEVARLADEDVIAQTTVSNWITAGVRPSPERVFAIEEVLGLAPGSLSRLLGFLPAGITRDVRSVPEAIDADPYLTVSQRSMLKAAYAAVVPPDAVESPTTTPPSARPRAS